jgi:Xaa-Pro aminopeptidase
LPITLADILKKHRPSLRLQSAEDLFLPLRAVKTEIEIEKIRAAAKLCDLAQQTLIKDARPGITELELFSAIYGALIPHAGGAFPMTTGLVGGLRTGKRLPGPSDYLLQPNDPVLFDVALNLGGYWGDNCNTIVLGEPGVRFQKLHSVVLDSLTYAKSLIAPGVRASDIDARVRTFIREHGYEPYSHHTGHGIGVSYHEAPRLVPYNHDELQAGNVLCLEPGIYDPNIGGVRLEDIVLVTANGCELLSQGGRPLSQ